MNDKKMMRAMLLAFRYIGDRSAGSGEAWDALRDALGLTEDATADEILWALERQQKETST
jgi:hypothetical protein